MSDLSNIIIAKLCVCIKRRGSGVMTRAARRPSGELVLQGKERPQVIKEVLVLQAVK